MSEIDTVISTDPIWKKVCLLDENKKCADDNLPGGTSSKGSFADVMKYAVGEDL